MDVSDNNQTLLAAAMISLIAKAQASSEVEIALAKNVSANHTALRQLLLTKPNPHEWSISEHALVIATLTPSIFKGHEPPNDITEPPDRSGLHL